VAARSIRGEAAPRLPQIAILNCSQDLASLHLQKREGAFHCSGALHRSTRLFPLSVDSRGKERDGPISHLRSV
jgi:hypothetical protein